MTDVRESSWNSIRTSFRGPGGTHHVLSNARDPLTRTRTSAGKIRRRTGSVGASGAGGDGAGGKQLLVRFLVRSITNPRTLVLGLVAFVMAPSLYLFSRSADWKKGSGVGRLAEPQGSAGDADLGSRHQPPTLRPLPTLPRQEEAEQHANERTAAETSTTPPLKPPALPVEVFREVPPEECLPSPLWEKNVDPAEYEFGCREIEVRGRETKRKFSCSVPAGRNAQPVKCKSQVCRVKLHD